MYQRRAIIVTLLVSFILGNAFAAGKQESSANAGSDYPNKIINVLIGFPPGGGIDALAQLTQPFLEKILGKGFVNQYTPGASGAIAWTQFAKQTSSDGYTLCIIGSPLYMTNYIMNPTVTYTLSEITPIANVVTDPNIIVVSKDSPYKTIEELIDGAKKNPGRITVGHSGVGSDDFFAIIFMQKAFGLKFQLVPFQGDAPSWQAAMGGKIDASFNNLGITYPQIKAANLRPLALFADKRESGIANVPTMKDLGHDLVIGSSRGWVAPKGISPAVRDRLIDAFNKMAAMPEFQKTAAERALAIDMRYGADYATFLSRQEKAFREAWDEVKDQFRTN